METLIAVVAVLIIVGLSLLLFTWALRKIVDLIRLFSQTLLLL